MWNWRNFSPLTTRNSTRGKVARGGSVDGELDDPILAASILCKWLNRCDIRQCSCRDYNRMDGYGKLPHLVSGFYNHVVRTPRIFPAFSIFTALLDYRVSSQILWYHQWINSLERLGFGSYNCILLLILHLPIHLKLWSSICFEEIPVNRNKGKYIRNL